MNKIISQKEAVDAIKNYGNEFSIIYNPSNVYPDFLIYPMSIKKTLVKKIPVAIVMDMDGTTTTTEELCIHSLENAIRKMSGKLTQKDWKGLDHDLDYPHIIGNSTTKHIEYLILKYSKLFKKQQVIDSFLFASLWTIIFGKDEQRKNEVKMNLQHFGLTDFLADNSSQIKNDADIINHIKKFRQQKSNINFSFNEYVKIAIDIYYQRYHEILNKISNGYSDEIANEVFGSSTKNLIEPMPGIWIFISLVKGWLGNEIENLLELLLEEYKEKREKIFTYKNKLSLLKDLLRLSKIFSKNKIKLALVTSSIKYEAEIVINEVFNVIKKQIINSPLSETKKEFLIQKFSNYNNVYDTFVTASDSNELRLKPHPDLYNIALHQLNINKKNFCNVIGFEDSESGTIAMRNAGINLAVAVPFAQTKGHNLKAASVICKGGLPEAILKHKIFVKDLQ